MAHSHRHSRTEHEPGHVTPTHGSNRSRLRSIARRAMIERGFEPDFSPAVKAAANESAAATAQGDPSIRDLRDLLWASVDNDDSRDLDQLSYAEPLADGAVKVLVAIADVDALVTRDSPVDRHAAKNTTSIYTAAQIFPMLPEVLSTDRTSLAASQERMAVVMEMVVAADGTVGAADIYRAVVLNRAKLAYNSVAAWLEGTAPAPPPVAQVAGMDEQLGLQDRVAQAMRSVRRQHGALSLDTAQARAVFDGESLSDLAPDEGNRAKRLIEDLMIAANGVSARFLEDHNFPSLRRVLREPKRWDRIVALAAALGTGLPAEPDARALDEFLRARRAAAPERFADLSLSVVKLLGSGEYALGLPGERATGHFGLAVRDYTHSTAPNRRFPDLITQRLLKAALAGQSFPYTTDELSALAQHCTLQEDNAQKVERQVQKSAAALLLSSRIGEQWDAMVTGASDKGTWVRIRRPHVEGKLVVGFAALDVGETLRVQLVHTDVERGFIDFKRVEGRGER